MEELWDYFLVAGILVDFMGFGVVARYGFSLHLWTGPMDSLIGRPSTPEERAEDEKNDKPILRMQRFARIGIGLVVLGFALLLTGAMGSIVT